LITGIVKKREDTYTVSSDLNCVVLQQTRIVLSLLVVQNERNTFILFFFYAYNELSNRTISFFGFLGVTVLPT